MSTWMYELTVPQFIKTLGNLSKILDKSAQFADSKKFETEVLLTSRLAPDQFNLTRQIQIACDAAKFGAARVIGKEAPAFEDNEKTIAELKTRIEKTIQYLRTVSPKDYQGAEEKRVTTPRWEGKTLSCAEFIRESSLPNFYFHVTTAYAILRHNGVPIGKTDYLGDLPFKN